MTELDPRALARLSTLGEEAARAANAPVKPGLQRSGRALLLATADEERARHPVHFRRVLPLRAFAAGLTLCALGALAFGWFTRERPLTYQIRGGQSPAPNYVAAASDAPASVQFSDGSEVAATAGARLRIESTRVDGARVLIEHGSARAQVKHREKTSWLFVAGPFEVHVTGTRFSLSWDQTTQSIDLTLHEGSVEVHSPLGSSHCVVRRGQRFRASVSAGTMQLENSEQPVAAKPMPPPSASGAPRAAAALDSILLPTARAASKRERPSRTRTNNEGKELAELNKEEPAELAVDDASRWTELVKTGSFQSVIDAANAHGLSQTLASSNAPELRALADAARYLGRFDLAERSLSALRERFAGTRHASAAAFLLGRTYEAESKLERADRQYTSYLAEAPRGEFAADALAGHMRSVAALAGPAAARPIASEYLRRYHDGVHAELARRLSNGQ